MAPKKGVVICVYCGLVGHRAPDCWISARGATKADDLDRVIASIDVNALRDKPSELRFRISRVMRKFIQGGLR